ncbi:MAG: CocE/NonD family hydrolase [Gammaproteobacteria bacterium]|nr:CocE/NonD family hydrolase [Gammaproteobacteria bacterium]
MNKNQSTWHTEHCWISMPDNIRLSARIWWPEGTGPYPAILEYIPYRKRDMVRSRDERNHPYFSQHGYVCLRVDMRGSGDSEGHMHDMYMEDEQSDARHLINWIAEQDWCNGNVGMFGTSWGGTASLQAAVDAPAPLKAVIANCATIDRFEDDIHWMDGTMLSDTCEWGTALPVILGAPPDVSTVGEKWWQQWIDRLENLAFPLDKWIQHSVRGDYWRNGSLAFNTENLSCPVLSIGGWADRYSNSVMKLSKKRPDICWGIVGPWGHHYPDQGEPGPGIGFQQLALEWWNHWLKHQNKTPPNWPVLRLWRREFDPPAERLAKRNGTWIEVPNYMTTKGRTFCLKPGCLTDIQSSSRLSLLIPNDLQHGECSGDTGYFGRVAGLPLEQSADDRRSLCFDSETLEENLDLIGHAEFTCDIVRDRQEAQLVCRICEIAPDGRSNLVTRHVLNLALDRSLDNFRSFAANESFRYRIKLPSTAYQFSRGNRIRLCLGTSYWPLVWPASRPASIRIDLLEAELKLPSIPCQSNLSEPFAKPQKLPLKPSWHVESAGELSRTPSQGSDAVIASSWHQPTITICFGDIDIEISTSTSAEYSADTAGSGTFTCRFNHEIQICRTDGNARIQNSLTAQSSETGMQVDSDFTAYWNSGIVINKAWQFHYLPVSFKKFFFKMKT